MQAARADADRVQNEAQTYANKVIPGAKGQAAQITAAAAAYRDRVIAKAQGQADRFDKVYESYKIAPAVIRERMYLETMEQVLSGVDKVIVDKSAAGNGVVPYLPLPSLKPGAGAPPLNSASPAALPAATVAPSTSESVQ